MEGSTLDIHRVDHRIKGLRLAQFSKTMGQTKNAQVAQLQPNTFACIDLKTMLFEQPAVEGKSYHGTLTIDNEDHSTFVEDSPKRQSAANKKPNEHKELQWHPLAGSLHGKVSVNANGAMLMLYIRHEDCNTNSNQLADIIVSEVEQIGDALADINMQEEVAKCGK